MSIIQKCSDVLFPSKRIKNDMESRVNAYEIEINRFFNNKSVKQLSKIEASSRFNQLVSKVTNGQLELPPDKIPTVEQLKQLQPLVKKDLKLMVKKPNIFQRHLYLGNQFVKNHKEVAREFDKMLISNEVQATAKMKYGNANKQVMDFMRIAAEGEGWKLSTALRGGKPKTLDTLMKMQNKYFAIKAGKDNYDGVKGPEAAEAYKIQSGRDYKKSLEYYASKGEGKIYNEFMEYVMMKPEAWKRTQESNVGDGNVKAAAKIWREKILKDTNESMVRAWNGFRNILDGLPSSDKETPEYKRLYDFAQQQEISFQKNLKTERGMFPVMTLDVMPTLQANLDKMISPRKGTNDFEAGANSILALKDVMKDNIYKTNNLKNKEVGADSNAMSFNYLGLLDSYVNNVIKLEHSLANTGSMLNVMKFVTNTKNKGKLLNDNKTTEFDEVNAGLQDYMQNVYMYQMGLKDINPVTGEPTIYSKMARMATSAQFFSKLGFNVRSALRNSAQSLFHFVHFGAAGVNRLNKELAKDKDLQARVNIGLEKSGLKMEFGETANIRDVYGQMVPQRIYNEKTGTYQAKIDFSLLDKLDKAIDSASTKSGIFMRKVENELNRGWAYKLGYVNAWKADKALEPKLRKQFTWENYRFNNRIDNVKLEAAKRKQVDDTFLGKSTEFEVKFENYKRNRAENAARDIVRLIHFDYSGINKAPLLRTKTGAVLGQFQHYGMSLFVLQKKWIQEGFKDVGKGDLFGEKANRMHRLFFMNTMVHGIFSPILNTDLGNLIQNDTIDRGRKWWTLWNEDDDEKRAQAFFNKGPVAGSLGPTVSTAIDVKNLVDETFDTGEMFAWYDDFDDDGIMSYMTGREYAAERDDDRTFFGKLLDLFNIQLGRLYNNTGPKAFQSNNTIGTFVTSEAGLYSTPEVKQMRKDTPALNPKTWFENPKPATQVNFDNQILQSLQTLEKEN
mgnify:CR=1 FL=1